MIFADIVIDISSEELDRTFAYRVPDNLAGTIKPGMTVTVPFGRSNRERRGYVTGLSPHTDYDESLIKEILSVDSSDETTESRLVRLAAWIRETYGSTMIQALRTVFPVREKMKIREKKRIILKADVGMAQALLRRFEKSRSTARARVLSALLEDPDHLLDSAFARKELGMTSDVLRFLIKEGIVSEESSDEYRLPVSPGEITRQEPLPLNEEQKHAANEILSEWQQEKPRPVLIHGVTGSGKTEVYMHLIEKVLEEGKQVIVLIPEISLTYQTVRRFGSRFGSRISILNSRLSPGERYDQFVRAKNGDVSIMIGPRSALFTPFSNLGLIIIDEEHEPAYKSESTPRYHAVDTAVKRAEMENARVVLGSATPSVESYTKALNGEYRLVRLSQRHEGRPMPSVRIIDLRAELKTGNRLILSRFLQDEMRKRLDAGEQTMLFLNRRGYAGFVSCRSCGHVIKCPHCDVSLSQHLGGTLVCHYCGYRTESPSGCPECGSPFIGGFKVGTQQAEQVIQKLFPEARILRMDSDTTRTKGSYDAILKAFAGHEADILIGTQMIVKGHDFPLVTLVGILSADLSLNASDFRSSERTCQLLTQAVGRAGRGVRPGSAVIQTYVPEHYAVKAAKDQDYEAFYNEEMAYRSMLSYPPAGHMLFVHGACRDSDKLDKGMYYASEYLKSLSSGKAVVVIGPAPESVSRIKDMYRQVMYLKGQSREQLIRLRGRLEEYININPGFRDIYFQFDFN
ncbi:MAG: primosomal protein N' [Blautia sp.]|nr:primosomal protein N' [Blautia sp.]